MNRIDIAHLPDEQPATTPSPYKDHKVVDVEVIVSLVEIIIDVFVALKRLLLFRFALERSVLGNVVLSEEEAPKISENSSEDGASQSVQYHFSGSDLGVITNVRIIGSKSSGDDSNVHKVHPKHGVTTSSGENRVVDHIQGDNRVSAL